MDKEELPAVFAVKKFHQFSFWALVQDLHGSQTTFGAAQPERATPLMASSRIQCWALTLPVYECELLYRLADENGNADALSRLPLPDVLCQSLLRKG